MVGFVKADRQVLCVTTYIMILLLAVFDLPFSDNVLAQVPDGLVIDPQDQSLDQYFYMGAASCNGSNCHGSTKPRPTKPEGKFSIPQNEYWIWLDKDFHTKAYKALTKPDSQRIAKNLGIDKPEESRRCLVCHAVAVDKDHQGPNYDLTEGVTCEGCHGPAERWLGPHTRKDWTKEKGAALGMFDTKNLEKRTKRCLACHLGINDKNQIVDHELIGAGHPRLNFELDNYSAVMPSHWFVHKDEPPVPYLGAQVWAVGQAVALRNQLQLLTESRKDQPVLWPDLIHFDCYSCHHEVVDNLNNLTETEKSLQRWRFRNYDKKPGRLIWNAASYSIYRHLVLEIAPEKGKALDQLVTTFHNQLTGKSKSSMADFEKNLKDLLQYVKDLVPVVEQFTFTQQTMESLLRRISADEENITNAGFQSAEQAVLAVVSLYSAYTQEVGEPTTAKAINDSVDLLYKDIESGRSFDLVKFSQHFKKLGVLLKNIPSGSAGKKG